MGQERGNCMCGGGSGGSRGSEVYPPALALAFISVMLNDACLSIRILHGGSVDTVCLPLILLVGGSFQVLETVFRNLLGTCVLPSSLLLSPGPRVPPRYTHTLIASWPLHPSLAWSSLLQNKL